MGMHAASTAPPPEPEPVSVPDLPAWDDPSWEAQGVEPLHMRRASDRLVAPHLHANAVAPDEALYTPIFMDNTRPRGLRNEPDGGIWSLTPHSNDAALFAERVVPIYIAQQPDPFLYLAWYQLHPDPDARLIIIDDSADFAAALARFPYGPRRELDYVAIERAGFAGVHLTEYGKDEIGATANFWNPNATVWLRWCFTRPATLLRPAAEQRDYASTVFAQRREHMRHVARGGVPAKPWGWWMRGKSPREYAEALGWLPATPAASRSGRQPDHDSGARRLPSSTLGRGR
jgi:hypothetical protein